MANNPSTPLLGDSNSSPRPSSHRSKASLGSKRSDHAIDDTETSPLLGRNDEERNYGDAPPHEDSQASATSWLDYLGLRNDAKASQRRWPTILALSILTAAVLAILGLGFAAPAVVEDYAREAMVFEPYNLSIESFTSTGVTARIKADFTLDASKVKKKSVRDLGRAGTWVVKEVESKESHVEVYIPEYGNLLVGTATIPPIKVSVRDGEYTHMDITVDLFAGDVAGLRGIAQDYITGSIRRLVVRAEAEVPLKSGIFGFGTQHLSRMMVFDGNEIPGLPPYDIQRLNFQEIDFVDGSKGMGADVIMNVLNQYPVTFTVPPLGFQISVKDCSPDLPHIHLADAVTESIDIKSKHDITARVLGAIKQLPDTVTRSCPQTEKSPLDELVGDYMSGQDSTIYVQGSDAPSDETPVWVVDFMKSITVPVSFPGKSFGNLIRNFSLEDVHFGLPNPFASPKSPEAHPRISAVVKALIGLPKEMNFPLSIPHVRATCEVFYRKQKLGELDLSKWQEASSNRIEPHEGIGAGLALRSIVDDAPLEITDEAVFSDLVEDLLMGQQKVVLGVKARVDAETETALGKFVVRDIPAEGKVFVKPLANPEHPHPNLTSFLPHITDIRITNTTTHTLLFQATMNLTNPTPYSATVPYFDILLLSNSTQLGHGIVRNVTIKKGNNTDVTVSALWDPQPRTSSPSSPSPAMADAQGRELISRYISGFPVNITLSTHSGSFPSYPALGRALSKFPFEIPMPRLRAPSTEADDLAEDEDDYDAEKHHHKKNKKKKHKHKKKKNKNKKHKDKKDDPPSDDDGNNDDGDKKDRDNDKSAHFIRGATFHIFSSTATFDLFNPLPHDTLHLSYLNATAYYNHTHPVGQILEIPDDDDDPNELPTSGFDIPPGLSTSPKLNVEWDLLGVGFGALKEALGGRLRLDARAEAEVELGRWRSGRLWFVGYGIGAGVRF